MGRPKPVYNEIRKLRKQLDDFTHHHGSESSTTTSGGGGSGTTGTYSIKQCRIVYTQLLDILSDTYKRQQLNEEAISDEDYAEYTSNDYNMDDDDDDDDDDIPTRNSTTTNTPNMRTNSSSSNSHGISRSIRARQRLALSEMWKSLITSCIHCTEQIIRLTTIRSRKRKYTSTSTTTTTTTTTTTSATKYHEEDINFPFKLLKQCYLFDPIFDAPLLPPSSSSSYQHSSSPNFLPSKLGREQSKLLYNFCINVLTDMDQDRDEERKRNEEMNDVVSNNNKNNHHYHHHNSSSIDAVEQIVLSMLSFICGKVELITWYYKAIPHVRHIMIRVVQPRILRPPPSSSIDDDDSSIQLSTTIPQQQIMLTACKIWYEVFHTCTMDDIGIGLQSLIPEAFDLFTSWCRQQSPLFHSATSTSVMVESSTYIFQSITILMKQDRDLCIASLQRHGYIILPYLKSCFQQYPQQKLTFASSIVMALHDFLLQYLIVCQEAGVLQGCMSCDLGDLGKGSLDNKSIYVFLDVLITSIIASKASTVSDKQQQQDKNRVDAAFKVLLEVTVRLLHIAQRNFLVRNEWKEWGDPTQLLIDHIEQQPNLDDYYCVPIQKDDAWPTCSVTVLAESPFIRFILRPIFLASTPSISTSTAEATVLHQALCIGNDDTVPPTTTINDRRLVAILHILCASAELFPLGSCWTTSAQNNWRTLSFRDVQSAFTTSTPPPPPPYDLITMNGCSTSDLATVIDMLGNVLDQFGSHNASSDVQKWTLRTLIRLTISTNETYNLGSKKKTIDNFHVALCNAWKCIWKILHDTNYCYNARTVETLSGSIGSLVLQLLTQIIRYSCTDLLIPGTNQSMEFILDRQCDLWNLKVFEQFQIHSSSPFILLYTMVARVGLKDGGLCSVGSSVNHDETWQSLTRRYGYGRRSKLLCFCLHFLSSSADIWLNDGILSALFACIAALVNGFSTPTWCLLSANGQVDMQAIIDEYDGMESIPICRSNSRSSNCNESQNEYQKLLFERLWATRSLDINMCIATTCKSGAYRSELVAVARRLVNLGVLRRELQHCALDLKVVPSESARLLPLIREDMMINIAGMKSTNSSYDIASDRADLHMNQLVRRITAVKSSIAIFLANSTQCNSEFLTFPLIEATNVLSEASNFLSSIASESKILNAMITNLIQLVRGLVTVHAERRFPWPPSFSSAASKIYDSCYNVLERCMVIESYDDVTSTTRLVVDEDFMDQEMPSRCSGRPKNDSSQRNWNSRRKTMRVQRTQTNQLSVYCSRSFMFLVGTFLIELDPVYKNYEFVTKRLLGVDILDKLEVTEHILDVLGGLLAVISLSAKAHRTVPEICDGVCDTDDSIPMLLFKVIRAIRVASDPTTLSYLFGYQIYDMTVTLYDKCYWIESLNSTEAKDLVNDSLSCERQKEWRKSRMQRPHVRLNQLIKVTSAFDNADTILHTEIDPLFGSTFVLPALSDLIQCIRRHACSAVTAAMSQLSEEKVVENVRKRLCPLTCDKDVAFKRWYAVKIGKVGLEDSVGTMESRIWDDARVSVRYDTLLCWCAIAATTSTREVLQQIIFDIISASVEDPFIEELCFLAIERISLTCGFSNVEMFLNSEMRDLSQRWIKSGWSFHQIPLMICVPSAFKCLMHARRLWGAKSDGARYSNEFGWDFNKVSEIAVFEFLKRQSKHFFPQIIVSSVQGVTLTAITKEGRRKLLETEIFKEYCYALSGSYNDEVAIKVVRKLIPMVMAEAPYLDTNEAENLILLLKGLLGEKTFHAKCEECTVLSFRRTIEIVGETSWCEEYDAFEKLRVLSNFLGLKNQRSMLQSAQCTVTELISFARFSLDTSQTDRQMISRWRSAIEILRLVVDDGKYMRSVDALFCFDFLLGIINAQHQSYIRIHAIKQLKEILLFSNKVTALSGSKSTILKKVFVTLMSFHRRCQIDLVANCLELWNRREMHIQYGTTLIHDTTGSTEDVSFWNWVPDAGLSPSVVPFREMWTHCNRYVPTGITEQIVTSYDVLELVVQESLSLDILHIVLGSFYIDSVEVTTCNQLSSTNPSFSAQSLVLKFMKDKVSIDELDVTAWKCNSGDSHFLDAAHIQMELNLLKKMLRSARSEVVDGELLHRGYHDKDLVLLLISLCSTSFPENTRISASQCLAEISITDNMEEDYNIISPAKFDRLSDAIEQDCLATFTQSCVLEAIATSIKSGDSRIALIAVDTLKVLLTTTTGRRCAEWLSEKTSKENLFQLVSRSKSMNCSSLTLKENEVSELRIVTKRSYGTISKEWCWDDSFWIHDTSSCSYELWISRLVAALLTCCYDVKEDTFFSACQRISTIDPSVASKIFPSVILDLLLRDGVDRDNDELDGVLADTWVGRCNGETNIQLSRCLQLFLKNLPEGKNPSSVELVVDLLDMLRRYTQQNFTASLHHKTNKKRNKEAKVNILNFSATCENDNSIWHGAPYGVVLRLDGLMVANACICSRRYEAAIFFAELFADARFGGPQQALTANYQSPTYSSRYISGFRLNDDESAALKDDIKSYFQILRQCYSALWDDDARSAIDQLESDFNFNNEQNSTATLSSLLREPPSLRKLMLLDNFNMRGTNSGGVQIPIINCLDGLGFRGLLETYIRGLTAGEDAANKFTLEDNEFLREKVFECSIFSKQWDDPIFRSTNGTVDRDTDHVDTNGNVDIEAHFTEGGFYEHLSTALDIMKRGNLDGSQKYLSRARLCFLDDLSNRGSKTSVLRNINFHIDRLRTLNDLEDYMSIPESTEAVKRILSPVDFTGGSPYNRSSFSDSIRATVMNFVRSNETVWNSISQEIASGLEQQFHLHLLGNRHQAAQDSLYRLDSMLRLKKNSVVLLKLRLHEAKLLEGKNDFNSAIRNAKLIIKNVQEAIRDESDECLLADSLFLCGQWMVKHKIEPASSILSNYLQPATTHALRLYGNNNDIANADRATRALLALGQLVSNLFDAVSSRISGIDWQKAEDSLTEREVECENLRHELARDKSKNHADQMYRQYLEREIKSTRTQRNDIVSSLETYRVQAVKSIATALVIAGSTGPEDMSKHVYRLVGLLFSSEHAWSQSIDEVANEAINGIPSFRFVPLVNQLLSRITTTKMTQKATLQNRLQDLIFKLSFDHPYHCLIHLIALSEGKACSTDTNDKMESANSILSKLIRRDPEFRAPLIESYKKLSHAYIHLATANTSELKQTSTSKISFDKICKSSNSRLDKCLGSGARRAQYVPCILTKPPTISPNKDYGDGHVDPKGTELVDTFESTFTITETGVNQPKIVVCIGSGQGHFKQLVKGADDTRQDAVMEQVFGYTNKILKLQRHSNSKGVPTHDLRLVTYNIVPLSHVAGVLEWVEHSTPFGDFIIDKTTKTGQNGVPTRKIGAHSRYFPSEWSSDRCRQILTQLWKDYHEQDGVRNELYDGLHHKRKLREAFDVIYEHHSPVFRYFFVENFANPEEWYTSKMRYTRSVAVSSIVGHILGIGDRHMSNILVHNKTGEVIHIDFGIVFEQGKRLRIPEIVPFRLTRNVVDGMGPIGIEGVFTKAAEDTLSVLKENSNGLLTILSAIVSDPLYKWSSSSKRESRRIAIERTAVERGEESQLDQEYNYIGQDRDENRNEVAAHAISRVHDKLLGYEDGTSGEQQSVESQVQLLMNAAQDPENLCAMFVGWAPFQ